MISNPFKNIQTMKSLLIYTLIFSLLLGIFSGCEDDLLEQANPNAITTDSFWKSKDDFNKAINALYSSLQFPAVSGSGLAYQMLRGDMAGTESWYGVHLKYTNLTWNDGSSGVRDKWAQLYIGIYRANQILFYLEDVDFFTEEERNLIRAQAKFLRGLNYFWLVNTFNQAVIHDELAATDEDLHRPVSARADVVSQVIVPDLEFAYNNLPATWEG
ncbi:MAG: RagB/SusD family nutrient uptake outer membrane protein, partial [Desulfobacterales bacterium]|nr:RagB/SusD family nutrient uptake outer membrane protein [Desulfobacterales bacterium]